MTLYDWGLAAGLIICSLVLGGKGFYSSAGTTAQIFMDNKLMDTIDLSQDRTYTYQALLGEIKVVVFEGKIRVAESHCPLKICQKQGRISLQGEIIVCLPNKFLIVIKSGPSASVQGVTG